MDRLMSYGACNCCAQPPHSRVELVAESSSASCSDTCGRPGNIRFLGGAPPLSECYYYRAYSLVLNWEACLDPEDDPPEGGAVFYLDETYGGECPCYPGPGVDDPPCSVSAGNSYFGGAVDPCVSGSETFNGVIDDCPLTFSDWSEGLATAYTYRSRSGNERAAGRARFRVRHAPTPTCYLKVWVRYRAQNWAVQEGTCNSFEEVGDPTFVPGPTYEWHGTGNPCLADPTKPVDHEDNIIEGEQTTLDPPDVGLGEGRVINVEWKYSILEGYEPAWPEEAGCHQNGLPCHPPA
jgi:hypothetical protein